MAFAVRQRPEDKAPLDKGLSRKPSQGLTLLPMALAGLVAFFLASPWAVLRPLTCWRGPWIQARMVAGHFDFPYTRQYAGTWPYFSPLVQLALWGLGPAATLAGLMGLALALWRWRQLPMAARVAWVWTVTYFLATAGLYVKFPRYLLPLYPAWVAWAVAAFAKPGKTIPHSLTTGLRWGRSFKAVAHMLILLLTLPLGLAQATIYAQPYPWAGASRWLYATLLPGETVVVEMWDHALPVPLPEGDSGRYVQRTLPVFDEETPDKRAQLEAAFREAEVIVLASRRGYGALARQSARYAETLRWYRALLAERDVVAFGRCPRLGLVALTDDPLADAGLPLPLTLAERCGTRWALRLPRLDESFRVYDAPTTLLLFQK